MVHHVDLALGELHEGRVAHLPLRRSPGLLAVLIRVPDVPVEPLVVALRLLQVVQETPGVAVVVADQIEADVVGANYRPI